MKLTERASKECIWRRTRRSREQEKANVYGYGMGMRDISSCKKVLCVAIRINRPQSPVPPSEIPSDTLLPPPKERGHTPPHTGPCPCPCPHPILMLINPEKWVVYAIGGRPWIPRDEWEDKQIARWLDFVWVGGWGRSDRGLDELLSSESLRFESLRVLEALGLVGLWIRRRGSGKEKRDRGEIGRDWEDQVVS